MGEVRNKARNAAQQAKGKAKESRGRATGNRSLQAKVHRLFYDSLVNFGILGLGGKESLKFSQYEDCYEQISSEKIYRKVR